MVDVTTSHDNALVVTTEFKGFDLKRILVDGGNSIYIGFLEACEKLEKTKNDLRKVNFLLVGFTECTTYPRRWLTRQWFKARGRRVSRLTTKMDAPSAYNAILGRTTINH